MFIFREKSGLQLVTETIGRGNPQKAGQRVNSSSLEIRSCPAFLLGPALRRHHGAWAGSHPSHASTSANGPPVHHLTVANAPPPQGLLFSSVRWTTSFPMSVPQTFQACMDLGKGSWGHQHSPSCLPPASSRHSALGKALGPEALTSWMRSVPR